MNTNNTQYSSKVVTGTPTSIIFNNIERGGGRVRSEVSTADSECECVPCEISGTEFVWEFNSPSFTKFVHNVCFIKVYGYECWHWCINAFLKLSEDLILN